MNQVLRVKNHKIIEYIFTICTVNISGMGGNKIQEYFLYTRLCTDIYAKNRFQRKPAFEGGSLFFNDSKPSGQVIHMLKYVYSNRFQFRGKICISNKHHSDVDTAESNLAVSVTLWGQTPQYHRHSRVKLSSVTDSAESDFTHSTYIISTAFFSAFNFPH